MPDFYQHGGFPVTRSAARSAQMRAELVKVQKAMAKLAPYTGNANKFVIINPDGTSYTTTATLLASQVPALDVDKINAGTFSALRIPNLDAAKIATGQFGATQVPNLPASKVTGTLTVGQVPNLPPSKINPKATISQSANYAITSANRNATILIDAAGGARTVTLPNLGNGDNGFTVQVMKTDDSANAVTLDGNGNDTINGAATQKLTTQYQAVTLEWDGSAWFLFAGGGVAAYNRAAKSLVSAIVGGGNRIWKDVLSVTITPSSSDAIIFLRAQLFWGGNTEQGAVRLLRGSVVIVEGLGGFAGIHSTDDAPDPDILTLHDKPGTTNAVTYKVQFAQSILGQVEVGSSILAEEVQGNILGHAARASDYVMGSVYADALSVIVTPPNATAKLRVSVNILIQSVGFGLSYVRILRGAIEIGEEIDIGRLESRLDRLPNFIELYDEPNTTSPFAYKIQAHYGTATSGKVWKGTSITVAEFTES